MFCRAATIRRPKAVARHGGAIILFIFVSAPVQVAILALAAGYKGNIADYLGYKLPRRGEVVLCLAILAAMIAIGDAMRKGNIEIGENLPLGHQRDDLVDMLNKRYRPPTGPPR